MYFENFFYKQATIFKCTSCFFTESNDDVLLKSRMMIGLKSDENILASHWNERVMGDEMGQKGKEDKKDGKPERKGRQKSGDRNEGRT
ncbi:predicted protein [Sclerotinia sclerotiorum 1980 UF-70]|uniref:Uncharacterized protein n=1 Tax=Sclerotinia sclerotiorum (strain ATCC 18683 / 1980 / Ss-1) TaxID=665079 RepID=A7F4V2_SCLS1|nr:predicted protein [Sclerotinia sclerotiorum 1980 UF-70]EDN97773.1 predicted protein [Sclerotinia sclerotiorum 1980 UF-70]